MRPRREVLGNMASVLVLTPTVGIILWCGIIAALRWAW